MFSTHALTVVAAEIRARKSKFTSRETSNKLRTKLDECFRIPVSSVWNDMAVKRKGQDLVIGPLVGLLEKRFRTHRATSP